MQRRTPAGRRRQVHQMRMPVICLMLSIPAVAACGSLLGVSRDASLAVTVGTGRSNGLDDPNGLASLEVEVETGGRGVGQRVFTAEDLPSAPFEVPESGAIEIGLRLRLEGRVVSMGRARWDLEPDVEWEAEIARDSFPLNALVENVTGPNPIRCAWFWCYEVWRFEIDAAARNYEDEALWLTIWRFHPDECADVCWE